MLAANRQARHFVLARGCTRVRAASAVHARRLTRARRTIEHGRPVEAAPCDTGQLAVGTAAEAVDDSVGGEDQGAPRAGGQLPPRRSVRARAPWRRSHLFGLHAAEVLQLERSARRA
jgi:hypothetical protein